MAKENFTQIPNTLMEILMSSALNENERRILLYIARKTYGYHKKSDGISLSQFENKLGIARSTVVKNLGNLQLVGIVKLVKKGNFKRAPNFYQIDTSSYERKLVDIGELVRYDREKLVGIGRHTKESITKERKKVFPFNEKSKKVSGDEITLEDFETENIAEFWGNAKRLPSEQKERRNSK